MHSGRLANVTAQALRQRPILQIYNHCLSGRGVFTACNPNDPPREVAVLGGGTTGLVVAHNIAYSTDIPVTLYERGNQLGGWIQTKHVEVGNGTVVFEQGPRALLPGGASALVTRLLVQLLHLERELVITPKTSVAARNRYVYHKDHLVRMPHPKHGLAQIIQSLWSEPLLHKALPGLLLEFHRPQRPSQLEDESVGAFVSRRLGSHTADNLVSAIAHGIYAGDIYQLSMKSIGRLFWDWEGEFGSMTEGWKCNTTKTSWPLSKRDCDILRSLRAPGQPYTLCSSLDEASQYSFRGGISTLVKTLEREVRKRERVTVRLGSKITEVSYNPLVRGVKIASTDGSHPKIKTFDSVVCTLPAKELAAIAKPSLPSLLEIHSVTVMVVNLYYSEPNLLPVHGFGYLIPRSVPVEQNPECALGVVFDSEAVVGLDTVPGTKVTVMLGGHWWDDWWAYPDEEHGARLAKAVLRRHLKIEREPKVVNVTLQKDCIPQYKVGHTKRLEDAHQVLQNGFKGQLKVAGNSYTGVGANDCISAAFIASHRTARQCRGYTGLEYVVDGPRWELFPRNLV